MNTLTKGALGALLVLGVAAGGYWYGRQDSAVRSQQPVQDGGRKVLYYRNPMGLPDTSPVPKKDAMGMDYIPVYAGEEPAGSGTIVISSAKVQRLGVQSEAATLRRLGGTVRASGRVEIDERRLYTIAPRFDGWVERLHVNTTGQTVQQSQPLFEVYSPELVSAQHELALAQQGLERMQAADEEARQGMQRLRDAAAARLKNWEVEGTTRDGQRITYRAPASGVVLEKRAVAGMRFMAGEMLYRIADLSSVWIVADVSTQDSANLKRGDRARVEVDALPGRHFEGKVDFIYPTLDAATRTVQLRIVVPNPDGLLRPAMYAQVELQPFAAAAVLAIPASAVIDSGTRQTVLVRLDEGRFEPRRVTLGARSDDYVEVLDGLRAGEQVVTRAQFLLDSESNLKAAFAGMNAAPEQQAQGVGHRVTGVLEAINADGTVSISHDPIPALQWPAMIMDFALANPSLAADIEPGTPIEFEIVERGAGEWVVTKLNARERAHAEHRH
ncbi:MAG: efflux RND transporter periplasmic adaptor subunit [Sideroxydans sp.]